MRVGILGLQHESNTFIRGRTTLADFERGGLHEGAAIRRHWADSHHEVGGFFEALERQRIEAVPLLFTLATPGPTVAADTLDTLLAMMWRQVDQAGRLDGLLVAPHGAGVSETHRDMDGHWLELLRRRVGPDLPIVCTLDAHANLTPRMVGAVNATVVYRTNPHLDQRARGVEAGLLLGRVLRREVRPTQAAVFPPIAINIERQHTPSLPCRPMYELADAMLTRSGVLSNSVVLGFPYADVQEMGSSFLVVTDDDEALARRLAGDLARYLVQHRHEFQGQFIDVEAAIDRALASPQPACLLDMGDNVGGGSAADGTFIAHAVQRRGGPATFVAICDPLAVEQARDAGVGATLTMTIGGKTDDQHGPPLVAPVAVLGLFDGELHEPQPRHGGKTHFSMGPTAVVRTQQGLTIQLMSRRTMPFTLSQITSCRLDPRSFAILVAKGVQAPVAAYQEVCPTIIRVNTPGSTSADMTQLRFAHRRRPLFPFEEIDPSVALT